MYVGGWHSKLEVLGMYWICGIYNGLSGNILGYPAIPESRIWRKVIESSIHLIFEMNYSTTLKLDIKLRSHKY